MNKPSKSQVLYERNMELQKAHARITELENAHKVDMESLLAKSARIAQLESWHEGGRSNIEFTETGVRICRGHHEKALDCEWEYFAAQREVAK